MTQDEFSHKEFKDVLKTTDFDLASTLYSLGFSISGIDKDNPRRVIFYFERTTQLEVKVNDYFAHKLLVDPLALSQARSEIMAQVHTDR